MILQSLERTCWQSLPEQAPPRSLVVGFWGPSRLSQSLATPNLLTESVRMVQFEQDCVGLFVCFLEVVHGHQHVSARAIDMSATCFDHQVSKRTCA